MPRVSWRALGSMAYKLCCFFTRSALFSTAACRCVFRWSLAALRLRFSKRARKAAAQKIPSRSNQIETPRSGGAADAPLEATPPQPPTTRPRLGYRRVPEPRACGVLQEPLANAPQRSRLFRWSWDPGARASLGTDMARRAILLALACIGAADAGSALAEGTTPSPLPTSTTSSRARWPRVKRPMRFIASEG